MLYLYTSNREKKRCVDKASIFIEFIHRKLNAQLRRNSRMRRWWIRIGFWNLSNHTTPYASFSSRCCSELSSPGANELCTRRAPGENKEHTTIRGCATCARINAQIKNTGEKKRRRRRIDGARPSAAALRKAAFLSLAFYIFITTLLVRGAAAAVSLRGGDTWGTFGPNGSVEKCLNGPRWPVNTFFVVRESTRKVCSCFLGVFLWLDLEFFENGRWKNDIF